MTKTKKIACLLLTMLICIITVTNTFADNGKYCYDKTIRTVFVNEGQDTQIGYFYMTIPELGITNTQYIPLSLALQATAPVGTSGTVKSEPGNYITIEQRDSYSGASVYYTVWNYSKKLRIMGHDEQLTYPALVLDAVYDQSTPAGYAGTAVALISVDDFQKIYGFTLNYWKEKQTMYFKRTGTGLLQKYKDYNPTNTQKKVSYATYSGFNYVPDYGAITGEKLLRVEPALKNMDKSKYNGYVYIYSYNLNAAKKYAEFLIKVGGPDFNKNGIHEDCQVQKATKYNLSGEIVGYEIAIEAVQYKD